MLKDKVAVVTGAARGIGREIALLMAKQGAARGGERLRRGRGRGGERPQAPPTRWWRRSRRAGGEAVANYESVATMAGGQTIVQTRARHFGRVDIVVNNAGILRDRMIFNMTEEEWDARHQHPPQGLLRGDPGGGARSCASRSGGASST